MICNAVNDSSRKGWDGMKWGDFSKPSQLFDQKELRWPRRSLKMVFPWDLVA
jgi:hypothetical protein